MSIETLTELLRDSKIGPADAWDRTEMLKISTREVPPVLFRERQMVLKGDQTRLWLRWFVEGLATPWAFVSDRNKSEAHIFEVALANVALAHPEADKHEHEALARIVAEMLFAEVIRRRSVDRDHADMDLKRALIEAQTPPRCYLCGYAFEQEAIDALLRVKGRDKPKTPELVDVFRPRGIHPTDTRIDIEHIAPVVLGGRGRENLALACRWCNRHKSARVSIYDAPTASARALIRIGSHQLFELPEPYWMVRMLGMHRKCQHREGCHAHVGNSEIFVSLRDWTGSPNPTNLRFHCAAHDPIANDRFIRREDAARLWGERRRGP